MYLANFSKTVAIQSSSSIVWEMLTEPEKMKQWMSETPIEINTDLKIGRPIIVSGQLYKKPFRNYGTVIAFEPEQLLEYTHLSSVSRLLDVAENYTRFSFLLKPTENKTELTLTLSNFPTEVIYKHLAFYWNVSLELLKKRIESEA